MAHQLLQAFVQALGRPAPDPAALAAVLQQVVARAHARWPEIQIQGHALVRALASRVPPDADPATTLALLHTDDIYLVAACLDGDAAAVEIFECEHLGRVDGAVARLSLSPETLQEVKQTVRERLLTGQRPLLRNYSGCGRLRAWVQVVAVRTGIRLISARDRERPTRDCHLEQMLGQGGDVELEYMKRLYQGHFKAAFAAAWDRLAPEQRTLLKQHIVDGVSINALAALYNVHKATTARWLQRARHDLLRHTRAVMTDQLRLDTAGFDSVMHLIESRLEVTLRLLAD